MAYIPYSPQTGAKYVLTLGGIRAVFNDPLDADYVGMLTEVNGLDSADVRESAEDLVQADGGSHGNFYWGRRPITLNGLVYGHDTELTRDTRLDKLRQASAALRTDAILEWENNPVASYPVMQTWVRRQQPLRFSGAWNKEFQLSLVSQYAPIFGATLKNPSHTNATPSFVAENQGNWPSYPVVRITGPSTNPVVVTNTTTGRVLKFTSSFGVAALTYVDIDVLARTATLSNGTNLNSYIDFTLSTWPTVDKGNNTFTLTGGGQTSATKLELFYRDAWS